MDKLWILFKNTFINSYKLNTILSDKKTKKVKSKTVKKQILTLLICIYIIGIILMYAQMTYSSLKKVNVQYMLISVFVMATILMMFFRSIFNAKTSIFNSKDNDMLFSMPIKPVVIFSNRVITLLISNYFIELMLLLPALVLYAVNEHIGLSFYAISIISLIFLPLIPVAISSVFGYLVAYFSSKFKRKNVAETILNFVFIFAIMLFSIYLPNIASKFVANVDKVNTIINKFFYPIQQMQLALINNDIYALLKFILINTLVFALFIYLLKFKYKDILFKLSGNKTNGKYKEKNIKAKTIDQALFEKELKLYFSIPIYVINTAFASVLVVIFSFIALIMGKDKLFNILGMSSLPDFPMYILLLAVMSFFITTINTTCSSISLEGNNLWILKALPIKVQKIFKAKINVNLVIALPAVILSTIIFSFVFDIGVIYFIGVILFEVIFTYLISCLGIITNLMYPKLDYRTPAQVVKQGFSAFLAMILAMIYVVLLCVIYVHFSKNIEFDTYYVLVTLLNILIIVIEKHIINSWGVKKFNSFA